MLKPRKIAKNLNLPPEDETTTEKGFEFRVKPAEDLIA